MKRLPIFLVAAMLTAAVSAPAQNNRGRRSAREGVAHTRAYQQHTQRGPSVRGERAGPRGRTVQRVQENTGRVGGHRGRDVRPTHGTTVRGSGHRGPAVRYPTRSYGYTRHYQPRGYWKTVAEQVLVEAGHWHDEYVPPRYGWVYDHFGRRSWGIIEPGGYRRVWCPARYETRYRRVWVCR